MRNRNVNLDRKELVILNLLFNTKTDVSRDTYNTTKTLLRKASLEMVGKCSLWYYGIAWDQIKITFMDNTLKISVIGSSVKWGYLSYEDTFNIVYNGFPESLMELLGG